jgi:2-C-methyl-D-erythritol 4-phosphate cytidylyltransferase
VSDTSAILLGAGRSRRLGFDKILSPLAGRPVLAYSLEALGASPHIAEIVLVTRPDIEAQAATLARQWAPGKPCRVVHGGAERQDSVWAGLQAASPSSALALIHDAARPLLSAEIIDQLVSLAREHGSAVCARPATDTLKEATPEGRVLRTVDRSKFWQIETPQVFRRADITSAYQKVQAEGVAVTDDASVAEHVGLPVRLVNASPFNLKITRPADWTLLELWLRSARGPELRRGIHELANKLSPAIGYLPLLEKYGSGSEKFATYFARVSEALREAEAALRAVQTLARELHPDRPAAPDAEA